VIGQAAVEISPTVKAVFFDLFLFATGYKVGPPLRSGDVAGPATGDTAV